MYHGGIEKDITLLIERAVKAVLSGLGRSSHTNLDLKIELEIPKDISHGDISTNIAMRISKQASKPPMDFAGLLKTELERELSSSGLKHVLTRVEVKPPGFVNFFVSKNYLSKVLLEIKARENNFGRSHLGAGLKFQVEFVSANPTGPLTIAHGRQAAIGDSLANILEFLGYKVVREYYLNDEGTQMNILGDSIRVRYLEACGIKETFPQDGYKGSYILDIAKAFKKRYGKRFVNPHLPRLKNRGLSIPRLRSGWTLSKAEGSTIDPERRPSPCPKGQGLAPRGVKSEDIRPFREFGLRWILNDIKKDLKDFGVKFDVWYSQRALRKSGKVDKAINLLKEKGCIYRKDGAVWFKSTEFGDDKDRVIYKSDGSATYLAPDIAYHLEKYRRGFKRLVDIWGPDHHGYVPRMKAAIQALGFKVDSLSVLIVQLATLYRHGQAVSMSTRAGEFITLREVIKEVGKDVARFCFIMRRVSSHLDFDLDAVKKESMENPVYYIQYAHARIWSILDYGKKAHMSARFDSGLLSQPEELELMRMMRQFPTIVAFSGKALEPYIILQYLQDLATLFHSFYNKHRVVNDDPHLTRSRIVLVDCVRIVLASGLRLLGVSFPKKM